LVTDVAPFEAAPTLGGVFGAEKKHDEFRLRAVETGEIDIQVGAGEFGLVVFVIENAILVEQRDEMSGYIFHVVAMLAWKRQRDVEASGASRLCRHEMMIHSFAPGRESHCREVLPISRTGEIGDSAKFSSLSPVLRGQERGLG